MTLIMFQAGIFQPFL
jgi:hypothetical protein